MERQWRYRFQTGTEYSLYSPVWKAERLHQHGKFTRSVVDSLGENDTNEISLTNFSPPEEVEHDPDKPSGCFFFYRSSGSYSFPKLREHNMAK